VGLHLTNISTAAFDSIITPKKLQLDSLGIFNTTPSEVKKQDRTYIQSVVSSSQHYKTIGENLDLLDRYNDELKRMVYLKELHVPRAKAELIMQRNQ
jgi:hypothetical protein